jgi:hypothetical protein
VRLLLYAHIRVSRISYYFTRNFSNKILRDNMQTKVFLNSSEFSSKLEFLFCFASKLICIGCKRNTQKDTHTQTHRQTQTDRHRQKQGHTHTKIDTWTDTHRQIQIYIQTDTHRQTHTHTSIDRFTQTNRHIHSV